MTGNRFFAVIRLSDDDDGDWSRVPHPIVPDDLVMQLATRKVQIYACGDCIGTSDAKVKGVVIGKSFSRTGDYGSVDIQTLASAHRAEVFRTGRFCEAIWGEYVAFSLDISRGRTLITRDPSGAQSCYYGECGEFLVVASDADDLVAANASAAALDWPYLAGHILLRDLRPSRTGLVGVTELLAGFSLVISGHTVESHKNWSPWEFSQRDALILDEGEAINLVRETVLRCVAASCARFSHPLLGLSGGLDSSIVAAALCAAGKEFAALVLSTGTRSGDERNFARSVARHLGVRLEERDERLDYIDLRRSDAAHLPRPTARAFSQSTDRIGIEVGREVGADVRFTGGGGDNVFCSLQSVIPVADRLRHQGIGRGVMRSAMDVSAIADCTPTTALWKGFKRAYRSDIGFRWETSDRFLSREALAIAHTPSHPWQHVPADGLPGQSVHVAWLLGIQNYLESQSAAGSMPMIFPLLSQPIVEACLRIPSWLWCSGGRNRSIARSAFSTLLPHEIVDRRSKGTPDGFVLAIIDAHRNIILSMLGDGLLRAHNMLDVPAIEATLGDPRLLAMTDAMRLMTLVDVEAWVRARSAGW